MQCLSGPDAGAATEDSGLSTGVLVAIILGVIIVLVIIVLIVCLVCFKCQGNTWNHRCHCNYSSNCVFALLQLLR